MRRWISLFTDHPATVGETYPEHMGMAFSFGLRMIGAGVACLLHGMVPALFTKTGSNAIDALHDRMVVNRRRHPAPGPTAGILAGGD